jgi:hypothetical protein
VFPRACVCVFKDGLGVIMRALVDRKINVAA